MAKKIKITWTYEYEPTLEYYPGAKTVEDCLKVDEANGESALYFMETGLGQTKFEVVEDSNV